MIRKVSRKDIADALFVWFKHTGKLKAGQDMIFKSINPDSVDAFFEVEVSKKPKFEKLEDIVKGGKKPVDKDKV